MTLDLLPKTCDMITKTKTFTYLSKNTSVIIIMILTLIIFINGICDDQDSLVSVHRSSIESLL